MFKAFIAKNPLVSTIVALVAGATTVVIYNKVKTPKTTEKTDATPLASVKAETKTA